MCTKMNTNSKSVNMLYDWKSKEIKKLSNMDLIYYNQHYHHINCSHTINKLINKYILFHFNFILYFKHIHKIPQSVHS